MKNFYTDLLGKWATFNPAWAEFPPGGKFTGLAGIRAKIVNVYLKDDQAHYDFLTPAGDLIDEVLAKYCGMPTFLDVSEIETN